MNQSRNVTLDIIRAVAVLAVMFGHLRGFLFVEFDKLQDAGILVKVFYYLTGFGHQSVMVFFVISGYLVGGSVLTSKKEGFWRHYFIQRLSRLWIVLIPCLAATVFWNSLGYHTGGISYLNGGMNPPVNSAPIVGQLHLDWGTLLGNLFFLQTILVPILGDNSPLWSLANEFWYYILFPFLFWGFHKDHETHILTNLLFVAISAVIAYFLPREMLIGFGVWLMGAAVSAVEKIRCFAFTRNFCFGFAAMLLCIIIFHHSRFGIVSNLVLGLAFCLILPWLLTINRYPKWIAAVSAWLSGFSYTLYLAHFPLASFLWYTFLSSERVEPSLCGVGRFCVFSIVLIMYAFLLSMLFEGQTQRLRRFITLQLQTKHSVGK
jgi:peptidoglycan/LPS O-acetylase OafA/YrhL